MQALQEVLQMFKLVRAGYGDRMFLCGLYLAVTAALLWVRLWQGYRHQHTLVGRLWGAPCGTPCFVRLKVSLLGMGAIGLTTAAAQLMR